MKRFLRNPAVQYLGLFALIALAFFWVLATPWATAGFVEPFTRGLVHVSAAILAPFDGRVIAQGDVLRFSDGIGAVRVLSGCNAIEVCALLSAAILAYPASFKRCLLGAAAGIVSLQLVNLLRIISLLYLSRGAQPVFDFFHHYVWDAMIGLEGLLIFFVWVRLFSGTEGRATS